MAAAEHEKRLGNRIAPARFILFMLIFAVAGPLAGWQLGWRQGLMAGFSAAAAIFLISLVSLFRRSEAEDMRRHARENDANRLVLLLVTGTIMAAILVSVASELTASDTPKFAEIALIVGTLVLAWLFSNMIYALHYAHLFYLSDARGKGDCGGLDFPKTNEPDYGDFVYFSYTLGMTFQTSDVEIGSPDLRRIATLHCLAAFVFNIGVLAFTINVLGGG